MKLPCEIVQDLLPLYHDGVCSTISKNVVQEHLPDCPACTYALESIQAELKTAPATFPEEIHAKEAMGALSKRWRRSKLLTALVWSLVAIGVTVMCFWVYNTLCEVDSVPAAASQVEVLYLYRTPDGYLKTRFRFTDGKRARGTAVRSNYIVDEQGVSTCYITMLRPRVVLQTTPDALAGGIGLGGFTDADASMRLCYGTPEDHFLIWEPGMEVPIMTEKDAALYFGFPDEEQAAWESSFGY